MEPDSDPPYYLLPERNLKSAKDDLFDHTAHIETLEDIVANVDTPWHIGLYGKWGSGKTSIVDVLYRRIQESQQNEKVYKRKDLENNTPRHDHEHTICVSLDAWKHAEESVRTELLLDLNKAIADDLNDRFPDYEPRDDTIDPADRPDSATPDYAKRYRGGVLDTQTILNRLYDVEENEVEQVRSIVETLKRLNPANIALLVFLCSIWFFININLFNTFSKGWLAVLKPMSSILLSGIALTLLLRAISLDIHSSRTEIQRAVANPQKDWSGAYEDLFRSILDQAGQDYENYSSDANREELTFVITIDDIDRCENETAYEILIALKSFLAIENCIYIIPCDKEALLNHLSSVDDSEYLGNSDNQQNFLAKLIDTEIEVTEPVPEQLDEYFKQQSNDIVHDLGETELDILHKANFKTPRRITRVLNRLSVLTELATTRTDTNLNPKRSPTRTWRINNGDMGVDTEQTDRTDASQEEISNWDMEYLAITAVLQEAYPRFYSAMVEDPHRLTEIYQQLHRGFSQEKQHGLGSYFEELEIPPDRQESLIMFLTATSEVGLGENPERYLRLGGSRLTAITAFDTRLRDGRTDALRVLLERKSSMWSEDTADAESLDGENQISDHPQSPFVNIIQHQLLEQRTRVESIRSVILIHKFFSTTAQDRIAEIVVKCLEEQDNTGQIFEDIGPKEVRSILESVDPPEVFMKHYVRSTIKSDGIDEQRLKMLAESYREQLMDENIQEAFVKSLSGARGEMSESDFQSAINDVKEICPQLYTPRVVQL